MSPRKRIKHKLDALVSEIVRARDKKCVVCGIRTNLQCGHYFSRIALSTRWDLKNCNTQCSTCNARHEHNTEPYRRYMVRKYGENEFKKLERKWWATVKASDIHLTEVYDQLKNYHERRAPIQGEFARQLCGLE